MSASRCANSLRPPPPGASPAAAALPLFLPPRSANTAGSSPSRLSTILYLDGSARQDWDDPDLAHTIRSAREGRFLLPPVLAVPS